VNILKEVLKNEVYPALGCTEPTAVAYAASLATGELDGELERIDIVVDPGVFKNGLAVTVPNSGGLRGNLIAGVLGALVRQPDQKMEVLNKVTPDMIVHARTIIGEQRASLNCDSSKKGLYIDVRVAGATGSARAVLARSHTNLVLLVRNDLVLFEANEADSGGKEKGYKEILKSLSIAELVDLAETLDAEDARYIRRGVEMNLEISQAGLKVGKVGHYLADLMDKGYLLDDVFSSSKISTAAAADARMGGINLPVMSSGGSGNQGIVAILVPWNVGLRFGIAEERIIRSIALSHLINSYTKCYTGSLAPICGCAIAAGIGAAAAIVYQQRGKDLGKITLAVNNLISDLGGMLCDGAKGGCSLKVVSSTDSAILSAYMALNDHGITAIEGFVGKTAEDTIQNLSMISDIGMAKVDATMIRIMQEKNL